MNNELENKLKSLTDLAKNFGFGKEEAVKLTKNLISEYKISRRVLKKSKSCAARYKKPQTASTKKSKPAAKPRSLKE